MTDPYRRGLLAAGGASIAAAALGLTPSAQAARRLQLGAPATFSFDALIEQARSNAARPYAAPPALPREVLERIDYDAHGKIRFDPDAALFADGPGLFPVTFFHLGRLFQAPVRMYVVQASSARELIYDPAYFEMPADSPAHQLPPGAGFAGFRIQESRRNPALDWRRNDWVAFLGVSYFRAIGELYQYGLSARGVAVDTAMADRPEEFPAFTRFYFLTPVREDDAMTVCALLEGPSLAGAYRFVMHRGAAVIMEVEAALFLRRDIGRLGLAPLTSMFWFSETVKEGGVDWRPEVHDSDGLAIWNGAGERLWRALNDPPRTITSAFVDSNPRGFGLLQRDRNVDHYLDGVHYERRPSLWVEPLDGWGEGSVQLVEIPTDSEVNDNIVAMWVPRQPAVAGAEYRLRYRLHWRADEPYPAPLARCVATRLGQGTRHGVQRRYGVWKLVVEFLGAPLAALEPGVRPQAVVSASRGRLSEVFTEPVPDGAAGHWRALFDLEVDGKEPAELRLVLKAGERVLSETWLYQHHPG
jgi:glucans biosynthesis protein